MATLHAFEGSLLEDRDTRLSKRRAALALTGSEKDDASLYSTDDEAADDDASGQNYGRAGLKRSNRLAFSYLCEQVAKLNERFLCVRLPYLSSLAVSSMLTFLPLTVNALYHPQNASSPSPLLLSRRPL
jgi:hypothetical protein